MLPIVEGKREEDEQHDESELRLDSLALECGGRQEDGDGGRDIVSDMSVGMGPNKDI
jgi:hypothetical protein